MANVIIPREPDFPLPSSWHAAMRRYIELSQHSGAHGLDPIREARRRRAFANGGARISEIATADEPLRVGHVVTDARRRVWRFRACDMHTRKVIYQRFVEAETLEEAKQRGVMWIKREWDVVLRNTNGNPPTAVVGSAVAI